LSGATSKKSWLALAARREERDAGQQAYEPNL
jgi:hypothetical protein